MGTHGYKGGLCWTLLDVRGDALLGTPKCKEGHWALLDEGGLFWALLDVTGNIFINLNIHSFISLIFIQVHKLWLVAHLPRPLLCASSSIYVMEIHSRKGPSNHPPLMCEAINSNTSFSQLSDKQTKI